MNMTRGTLEFGPFRLESGPDRLWRDSEEIALRPKSLKVLAYLAHRPGRLVSKDELREQVWGTSHVSDARLRVTVHEVRAALGNGQHSPEYLETVPGRGYRFVGTKETSEPDVPLRGGPDPVVGRERELEYLVNRFLEANRGERRLVFIGGGPGVGKTTLVDLFMEHLAGRPHTTCARGQCVMHSGAGEAHAPVLEALGRVGQERSGRAMIRVLEHCAPMWLLQLPALVESEELERLQHQVRGATVHRMVRELNDALELLTAKDTLVLVLEDLHWSDVATLDLLTSIAQRPEPARLLIVATYRPADAIVHAPDFSTMLHELEGRGLCERLDLELLTSGDVAAYVSARIDSKNTADVATAVHQRSDGNALFMVNLFEYLLETHAVERRDGRWVVDGASPALTQVPEGLRPFIERRLDALSDEDRALLEVASIAGVEFTAAAALAGLAHSGEARDRESIETRLESLVSHSNLIAPCGPTGWPDGTLTASYRFGHALYRDSLYQQIPESRRVRLHRRVGEQLRKAWGEDPREMAVQLADHFERGRDPGNAARYRRMAGERALGKHAYHEASRHFQAALEAFDQARSRPADGDPEDTVRWELEVCTALGSSLINTRGYTDPEAEKIHLRAVALSRKLGKQTVAILPALYLLMNITAVARGFRESSSLTARMTEIAAETDDVKARLVSEGAREITSLFRGDLAASDEAGARVLALYDPNLHDEVSLRYPGVSSLGATAWRRWLTGSPDQAVRSALEGLTLAERVGDPYGLALASGWAAFMHQFRRDLEALRAQVEGLEVLAHENGFQLWVTWTRIFRGFLAGARGDGADGIALMEQGLEELATQGHLLFVPYFLGILAETQLAHGRVDAAEQRVKEANAMVERRDERWWEAELHRLQGEIVLAATGEGDRDRGDRAEACFRRALEVAGRQGATSLELRAALSLSRLGNSPDAHQLLSEVVSRFTEGQDTADLRAAHSQLSAIR